MINLFTLLKKLFNVDNVESVTDEMVENYFAKQNDDKVVENTDEPTVEDKPVEEVTDKEDKLPTEPVVDTPVEPTVVEEVVEAEVNPPVVDEPVAEPEDKKEDEEDKPHEVLTKEVISNAANNMNYKDNLMSLKGDAFFTALHKHQSELRSLR